MNEKKIKKLLAAIIKQAQKEKINLRDYAATLVLALFSIPETNKKGVTHGTQTLELAHKAWAIAKKKSDPIKSIVDDIWESIKQVNKQIEDSKHDERGTTKDRDGWA